MKTRTRISLAVAAVVLFCLSEVSPALAEGPPVRAGTSSQQKLRAPEDRNSFDFVIFGDHKGGPIESIEVLKDGVSMANILDPDFVMTVGDLVGGYNEESQWVPQMEEFKAAMKELKMPWYPVVGNHDVYNSTYSEDGNIELYKKYFGPLYYSFDYKWAHFIVLFSDESMSYQNPAKTQNFSEAQMDWLRMDLASTSAKQLFIFMHHPRWTGYYDGCNWPKVHEMLVKDGRPTTVVAGHIHYYRYDGQKDNVTYYAMATTGGHRTDQLIPEASLHHINLVRVRPERVAMTCLPVGCIRAGDFVYGSETDEMWAVLDHKRVRVEGNVQVGIKGGLKSELAVTLENPTSQKLSYTVGTLIPEGWTCTMDTKSFSLEPKQTRTLKLQINSAAVDSKEPSLQLWAKTTYKIHSGFEQPLEVYVKLPVEMVDSRKEAASDPENNGVLSLDGSSAVRVDLNKLPALESFTLECWVRGKAPAGKMTLLSRYYSGGYGLLWCDEEYNLPLPSGHIGLDDGHDSITLKAPSPWEWKDWTHMALVFDQKKAVLFVNGKPVAEQDTADVYSPIGMPFYVGAGPSWNGKPHRFFEGAVDEVRLSSAARYAEPFEPAPILTSDDKTVLLLHFDHDARSAFPSDTENGLVGWSVGAPRIVKENRVARAEEQ